MNDNFITVVFIIVVLGIICAIGIMYGYDIGKQNGMELVAIFVCQEAGHTSGRIEWAGGEIVQIICVDIQEVKP